jgi:plasmid stabilization system protein ParE
MSLYELTASAQEDFKNIANRTAYARSFSKRYPQVLVSRCEHHYIFYLHQEIKPPRIIAVLHERMDMLRRLTNRIEYDFQE